ncbi:MAG: isopentenyl-diphosphate Delta-isomerase [Thermoanaerobaculaceae bacterium]|nr:isopentenyl-diphosphate Delta-isomerase [Thermoanaerobaculaceae bacterium]MDI9622580.1 isopentenyl-diphosphate Delta-isomerase [Acidobacteriota bacterium]NLH10688.1 isopentenyl-diphosphate Delta-isomerase [Holophagae bacterium]HPW54671.1 isopentenyl-diphosphate Delta-isomerase [Thermoanaerobaculaceae bacterium]
MAPSHPAVSFADESLILVDELDREIGFASKQRCHEGEGLLHRAFSVFLFDADGRVLLQQRAKNKPLWPGFWANSCCSHPRRGETVEEAAQRRVTEELGVRAELEVLFTFTYHARYRELGSERELCWVLAGRLSGDLGPNPNEVAAWRLVTPSELDSELADRPELYSPWLHLEWPRIRLLGARPR